MQPWTDLASARASWGVSGDVLTQFPNDVGTTVMQSFTDWVPTAAPAGNDQTITLDPAGPSKLPLSAFAGISKFKLSGYSNSSFLVITVSPSDVVGGRVTLPSYSFAGKDSPEKLGISHILFDFSAVSGAVQVTTQDAPVRGAIYAPNAHIVFPSGADGREFEGQIIAREFSALQGGNEIHTNLFAGRFACETAASTGTFNLAKVVSGVDPALFPAGTTFPVTATWSGGQEEFDLPADGTVVPSGLMLPEGTVVTLTEGALPAAPAGYEFVSRSLSADRVTILDGGDADIAWTVTNTYAQEGVVVGIGGFDLAKTLVGVDATDFPSGTVFTVRASWTIAGTAFERQFELPAAGTVVVGPRDIPSGTRVTFSEVNPPEVDGFTFTDVSFSPETLTVGNGEIVQVDVVNRYAKSELASTGAAALGLVVAGALGALLGGSALLLRRRRRA